jgi:hypothetical protein
MYDIQPKTLTDAEFARTCYQILIANELPKTWQEDLLSRYEDALEQLAEIKK